MPNPIEPPVLSSANIIGSPGLTIGGIGVFVVGVGAYLMEHSAHLPDNWLGWVQLIGSAVMAGALAFLRTPAKAP